MRWVALLCACACGRIGFDPNLAQVGDAGGDGDITPADASTRCVSLWLAGTVSAQPINLAGINTAADERNPTLSDDGQTLYFMSTRDEALGDVYRALRVGTGFGTPAPMTEFNTSASELGVSISIDGLTAFFTSDRSGAGRAFENFWQATRNATSEAFGAFTVAPFVNINSDGYEYEPTPSRDLLRLYWSQLVTTQDVVVSTRTTVGAPFGAPSPLSILNSPTNQECCATLSSDERVIVFTSDRTGASDIYYATRPSVTDAFSAPQPLPGASDPAAAEVHTYLTPDACTLYWSSGRTDGVGSFDIWYATVE